jgi:hypothetical protein
MDSNAVAGMFAIMFFVLIVLAVVIAILIVPYWKIYSRTGQSGALSLLQLIPVINVIMLFILAFGEWPIERELKDAQRRLHDLSQNPQSFLPRKETGSTRDPGAGHDDTGPIIDMK